MKRILLLLAILSSSRLASAQENKTTGNCSPIVITNNGALDIHCTGLDPALARQISLIVTQVSSIKKSMATEATQQEMLKLLEDLQHRLDQIPLSGPKRLDFNFNQIDHFIRVFKSTNAGASLQGIEVQVDCEWKVRNVGKTLVQALEAAGVPVTTSLSQHIDFIGADHGIFGAYQGDTNKALHLLNAISLGLREAGVIDGKLPLAFDSPGEADMTRIQILIKD